MILDTPPSFLIDKVKVAFGGGRELCCLQIPHFKVMSGARILIEGQSGSGKTTLLHLLAGLLTPNEGNVTVDGLELGHLADKAKSEWRRKNVGIVFQSLNLLNHLTALENVLLGNIGKNSRANRDLAIKSLKYLDVMHLSGTRTNALSHGECQRIAVARILATKPKVILADEPTSSLDAANAELVIEALCAAAQDATLVVVSHDQRLRSKFAKIVASDRLIFRESRQ